MLLLENATMPTRTGLVALGLNTGVGTMVHAVPSQCSARVLRLPAAPTAQTSFDAIAATPNKMLSPMPFGLGTMLQLAPFQWMVRVFPSWNDRPTAQTSFEAMASTAKRRSSLKIGLGTMLQAAPFQCRVRVKSLKVLVSVE